MRDLAVMNPNRRLLLRAFTSVIAGFPVEAILTSPQALSKGSETFWGERRSRRG